MSSTYASSNDVTVMREGGRRRLVTQKGAPIGPCQRRRGSGVCG